MTDQEMFERIHSSESFKIENVRKSFAAAVAAAALLLTGCATDMSRYYAVQEKAVEADNNAVMGLAAAAATGNQGAIMALALRQGSAGKIAPPQDKALVWASVLIPSLTNLYGINRNTSVQLANINAETERYGTTMSTLGGIAGQGIDAAAKDPVVISTTLTGSSVLYPREPVSVAAPVAEPAPAQ